MNCINYLKLLEFVLNIFFVFKNVLWIYTDWKLLKKSLEFVLSVKFFVFKNFSKDFIEYIRIENPSYKNENVERKYLNNMQKSPFLKVKKSPLESEKDFIELKAREVKMKWEIEELFFKPTIVSIYDMDKFEENEMKKIRSIKNTWYD